MTAHLRNGGQLLVRASWPGPKDLSAAAAALSPFVGVHRSDLASQLKRCRGLFDVQLDAATAAAAAAALTEAGHPWHAVPAGLAAPLPKALTARGIDPRDADVFTAPVRMTGPPESGKWRQVLAAVPATWQVQSERRTAPKAKKRNIATVAVSIAMTGGIDMLLSKKPKAGDGAMEISDSVTPMLVLIVAGGPNVPLKRLHIFANRCDYGVLAQQAPVGGGSVALNWRALLHDISGRLRPDLAGGALLRGAAAGRVPPSWLTVDDNNDLARSVRWLMCTAALRRMGRLG